MAKSNTRSRIQKQFKTQSRTVQSDRDSTDIKRLVNTAPPFDPSQMTFADVTDIPDFRATQDRLADVYSRFAELPSEIREKFENEPANLVEFVQDPDNIDDAVELGLLIVDQDTEPEKPKKPRRSRKKEEIDHSTDTSQDAVAPEPTEEAEK